MARTEQIQKTNIKAKIAAKTKVMKEEQDTGSVAAPLLPMHSHSKRVIQSSIARLELIDSVLEG